MLGVKDAWVGDGGWGGGGWKRWYFLRLGLSRGCDPGLTCTLSGPSRRRTYHINI